MATWLIGGLRSPFARVDGALRKLDAVALSVPVAQAMAAQLPAGARADLVVWGTVAPNLGWSNIARELVIDAKLDPATPAFSTVLACSTSMVAVFEAAGMLGHDVGLAMCGGVESMSRVQIGLRQGLSDFIRRMSQARSFGERIDRLGEFRWKDFGLHIPSVANRATGKSMGEHCEEMAKEWNIARSDQDRIALQSHQVRAVAAMAFGILRRPRDAGRGDGEGRHPARRQLRCQARVAQARVRPRERSRHHHRGQRLGQRLTDGAAAIWVANEAGVARAPGEPAPKAKLVDWEIAAVDIFHEGLLMAPAYAIPRLLARNNLTYGAIDLWEIHEAFAAQVLCNVAALESESFLRDKAKVHGAPRGKFPWDRIQSRMEAVSRSATRSARRARASSRRR